MAEDRRSNEVAGKAAEIAVSLPSPNSVNSALTKP